MELWNLEMKFYVVIVNSVWTKQAVEPCGIANLADDWLNVLIAKSCVHRVMVSLNEIILKECNSKEAF